MILRRGEAEEADHGGREGGKMRGREGQQEDERVSYLRAALE